MKDYDTELFPEFAKFVENSKLLESATGAILKKVPRILGSGSTQSKLLELPPSTIERKKEISTLKLPENLNVEQTVKDEIELAKNEVKDHGERMSNPDLLRRFALESLDRIKNKNVNTGRENDQFFAGKLVLVHNKTGQEWAWCMTRHYPLIDKIPADVDYIEKAYNVAEQEIEKHTMPMDKFRDCLSLSWKIARHFSDHDNVLIADVARTFKVVSQREQFWRNPYRRNFEDVPEAVFQINLINWRSDKGKRGGRDSFKLTPATLNQSLGPTTNPYYLPLNSNGTSTSPVVYIQRISNQQKGKTNGGSDR